jgi:hypothetical protein
LRFLDDDDQMKTAIGLTKFALRPRCVGVFRGCSCVATSVVAADIYREDLPRVTASHNRLGLSLSKHIRHELIAKINGKRRPRTCEALGWILVDYSCTRRAPAPIASPCAAPPDKARRASVRAFLLFCSPPHSYKCIESNPPYKQASLHLHYQGGTKVLPPTMHECAFEIY